LQKSKNATSLREWELSQGHRCGILNLKTNTVISHVSKGDFRMPKRHGQEIRRTAFELVNQGQTQIDVA
jgi:hypothetical protein